LEEAPLDATSHGQITIFSLDGCMHCRRVKATLESKEWPYREISLSLYPTAKNAMLKLSDRLTVPQIFFNAAHIGGASELHALDDEGELDAMYAAMAGTAPPTSILFAMPTMAPAVPSAAPALTEPPICIAGECSSYSAVLARLTGSGGGAAAATGARTLEILDRKLRLRTHRKCFSGAHLVDVLLTLWPALSSRAEAAQVGSMLFDSQMFAHVSLDRGFVDDFDVLYRLQADAEPLVLNSWRVWGDRVDADPLAMLNRCRVQLKTIISRHISAEGRVVYDAVAEDADFAAFEEAVCEVQTVNLPMLADDVRLAFCLNLYNLCIMHAFAKVGSPETTLGRMSFFNRVSYTVGGLCFSLTELESGVIRANRAAPFTFSAPFRASDPRRATSLPVCDARIHFALNCGAASCPPIKVFSAVAVQEELRIVALAFCEQESNVSIDVERRTVRLSQIFNWYAVDFGGSQRECLKRISGWLRGTKKEELVQLLCDGRKKKKVKVIYVVYDWSTNAAPGGSVFGGGAKGEKRGACAIS
jgi:glutaredoxin|tara:strand:- start:14 stop:1606 length:1593 start_codon:yes stop_codon:yes gene_type:complete